MLNISPTVIFKISVGKQIFLICNQVVHFPDFGFCFPISKFSSLELSPIMILPRVSQSVFLSLTYSGMSFPIRIRLFPHLSILSLIKNKIFGRHRMTYWVVLHTSVEDLWRSLTYLFNTQLWV